jgi:MFS family permease
MDEEKRSISLSYGLKEAYFSGTLHHLAGGIFLTGFAVALGASHFMIGLMAALPASVSILHVYGSYKIGRRKIRKQYCVRYALSARIALIGVSAVPFLYFLGLNYLRMPFLFLFLVLFYGLSTLSLINWLSWMYDLVPLENRGRYFAKRHIIVTATGLIVGVLGGRIIDYLSPLGEKVDGLGFSVLFLAASMIGLLSIYLLKKMEEPVYQTADIEYSFMQAIRLPFKDRNFTRLLVFRAWWEFSVWMAAPFFIVFMIVEARFSFTFIASLTAVSGLTNILTAKYWGIMSDRYGHKPVLFISTFVKVFFPLPWFFVTGDTYFLLVAVYFLSGLFDSGLNLASTNIGFRLAPGKYHHMYLAVYTVVAGVMSGVGPLIGGVLIDGIGDAHIYTGAIKFSGFYAVFFLSFVFRACSLLLLRSVREDEARAVSETLRGMMSVLYK